MTATPTPNSAGQTKGPGAKPAAAKTPSPKLPGVKTRTAKPTAPQGGAAGGAHGGTHSAMTPKPGPGKAATGKAMPGDAMPGKSVAGKTMAGKSVGGKTMPIKPLPAKPKPMPGKPMTGPGMPSGVAGGAMAGGAMTGGAMTGGTSTGRAPAVTLGGKPAAPPKGAAPMSGTGPREAGCLGKLAPQFPTAVKPLHHYITKPLPPAPTAVNYAEPVLDGFPMDGNDRYGDCTMAAAAHLIQAWNTETGIEMPVPAEPDVIAQYLELSGGQDTGLVESQVLQGWLDSGLWDNKIVAYAPVNVHSLDAIKQAVAYFGGVYVGVQIPENAQQQFERHQPWYLEEGWQAQRIEGGHAIPILGYDDQYLYGITWGAVQPITWDWWSIYGDEAWVVLSSEFDQAGKFNGIDIEALRADIAAR